MTLPLRTRRERRAKMMPPKDTAPIRSKAHRDWVGLHWCCVPNCQMAQPMGSNNGTAGGWGGIEVAHVRTGTNGGMGMKPGDDWTISLCEAHHAEQHQVGEAEFEWRYGIDMKALAQEFAAKSPKLKNRRRP